ncbi:MAG: hypothetical protein WCF90_00700 [Methanomicrobiales archaeon]
MSYPPDNQGAPFFPERYQQQVKANGQRCIYKKLETAGLVIVIVIIAVFLLSGVLSAPQPASPAKSPALPVPIATVQNATWW